MQYVYEGRIFGLGGQSEKMENTQHLSSSCDIREMNAELVRQDISSSTLTEKSITDSLGLTIAYFPSNFEM